MAAFAPGGKSVAVHRLTMALAPDFELHALDVRIQLPRLTRAGVRSVDSNASWTLSGGYLRAKHYGCWSLTHSYPCDRIHGFPDVCGSA